MYCTNTMKIEMNNNIKAIKAMDMKKLKLRQTSMLFIFLTSLYLEHILALIAEKQ